MAKIIFKNNAQSVLGGAGIGPSNTSASLQPGTGALFGHPNTALGEYWVGTIIDAATGLRNEIVYVTQVVGDTVQMVRGQEGTAPQTWAAGDAFAELWTAGQAATMQQKGDEQSGSATFGIDQGPNDNNFVVALTPPLTVNTMGQTFRFKAIHNSTGPSVINFGTGSVPLLNAQGQPLSGGEIVIGLVYEVYWNGAGYNLSIGSAVRIPTGMIAPFGGSVAPVGWLGCLGQTVNVSAYPALFDVLGAAYGGNGTTTFGIPDLRGRVPAGLDAGQNRITSGGSGIAGNTLGASGGAQSETTTVDVGGGLVGVTGGRITPANPLGYLVSDVPTDSPFAAASAGAPSASTPSHTHHVDLTGTPDNFLSVTTPATGTVASTSKNTAAVTNVQPTLMVNFIIKT